MKVIEGDAPRNPAPMKVGPKSGHGTSRPRLTICLAAVVAVVLLAAGCTSAEEREQELQQRAEARAALARGLIDDLAAAVGTDLEVRQDVLTACVPGDDDSGLDLIYMLHVRVEAGAVDRVRGEIADRYEADGWTIRRDPSDDGGEVSTRFIRGTFSMGANISEESGRASVGGSGGCVR